MSTSILDQILREVGAARPELIRSWFCDLTVERFTNGTLTVRAANDAQQSYLDRTCKPALLEALQRITGRLVAVAFTVAAEQPAADRESLQPLPTDCSLERFVVGACNRLAHAAVGALLQREAPFQLLYLYGPAGAGKSHLVVGATMAWNAASSIPGMYLRSPQFTDRVIASMEERAEAAWIDECSRCSWFVLDDLQEQGNRSRSQEALFHILCRRGDGQLPTVLVSERSPDELVGFPNRLLTRFRSGMVAALDWPDVETRLLILRRRAAELGLTWSDSILMQIATVLDGGDVARLQAGLVSVERYARSVGRELTAGEIGQALVERALGSPDVSTVLAKVASYFGHDTVSLAGFGRGRGLAMARRLAMYLANELAGSTPEDLSLRLSGRNPQRIRRIIHEVASELRSNKRLAHLLMELREQIAFSTDSPSIL